MNIQHEESDWINFSKLPTDYEWIVIKTSFGYKVGKWRDDYYIADIRRHPEWIWKPLDRHIEK